MRVLTILFLILFGSKAWAADPATEATQSSVKAVLDAQTVLLQEIADSLAVMQVAAGPLTTDLWLFEFKGAAFDCNMNLHNIGAAQEFSRTTGDRKWFPQQSLSGGDLDLARLIDIPLGSTLENQQDFMWELFKRLNGLPPGISRPLAADAVHTDCLEANRLVLGNVAYPP